MMMTIGPKRVNTPARLHEKVPIAGGQTHT
jgi:hypothetical protein